MLLQGNRVNTTLECSVSGTTDDDLIISTSWTSIGECGQYTLSWAFTTLGDPIQTDTGTGTPTTEGRYSITDVMPVSEYDITLLSAGEKVDSCIISTIGTGMY